MSSGAGSSRVNLEGVMLFEQPFARVSQLCSFRSTVLMHLFCSQVPYENYRKVFRTTQRYIEKDFSALQTTTSDLAKRSKDGEGVDKEDAIQNIDAMITRVENLKRKVSETVYRHP